MRFRLAEIRAFFTAYAPVSVPMEEKILAVGPLEISRSAKGRRRARPACATYLAASTSEQFATVARNHTHCVADSTSCRKSLQRVSTITVL
jgi:hypothetical protein